MSDLAAASKLNVTTEWCPSWHLRTVRKAWLGASRSIPVKVSPRKGAGVRILRTLSPFGGAA